MAVYDKSGSAYDDGGGSRSHLRNLEQNGGRQTTPQSNLSPQELGGKKAKSVGPEQLGNGERTFADDELYKTAKKHRRRWSVKKAAAAGGILGVSSVAGLGAFFTLTNGPLQFVHLADMLTDSHMAGHNARTSNRMLHVAKYIRYKIKGQPERARLTFLQNKFANKIETRFKDNGYTFEFDKKGNFTGIALEPERVLGRGVDTMTPGEIKGTLEGQLGTTVTSDGNGFRVRADSMGFAKSYGFTYHIARTSGYSVGVSGLVSRLMGKLALFDWHVMKSPTENPKDAKAADERNKQYAEEDKKYISEGAHVEGKVDTGKDKDGKPVGQKGADAISDTFQGDPKAVGQKIRDKLNCVKLTSVVGAIDTANCVITVACLVLGFVSAYFQLRQINLILPMMHLAMLVIVMGNQIKDNSKDIDFNRFKYEDSLNNDPKLGTAISAASIQARGGGGYNPNNDLPKNMNPSGKNNIFAKIVTATHLDDFSGALKGVCDVATNTAVQAGIVVINILADVFSGGTTFTFKQGIKQAISTVIQAYGFEKLVGWLTSWVTGNVIDPATKGVVRGAIMDYGTRLAANGMAITSGGKKLSNAQTAELDNLQTVAENREFSHKSFASRMFDTSDYHSTLSRVMDAQNTNPAGEMRNVASGFLNLGRTMASMPLRLVTGVSSAAALTTTPYQYPFPEFGFTVAEMDNPNVDNPYENVENVGDLLAANPLKAKDYEDRVSSCFDMKLSQDETGKLSIAMGANGDGQGAPDYHTIDPSSIGDDATSADIDPHHCTDSDPDWLRIRMVLFDTNVMNAMACYEAPESGQQGLNQTDQDLATEGDQACKDIGYEAQPSTTDQCQPPTNIDQKIAQTMMIGVEPSKAQAAAEAVKKYHLGGVFVLGDSSSVVTTFNKQYFAGLNNSGGLPLFTASDEEGKSGDGGIQRYDAKIGQVGDARQMGRMVDLQQVQNNGTKIGKGLKDFGINMDLAPVLDLDTGNAISSMGRSFGSDPIRVMAAATRFAAGLQSNEVVPVFKHFPGFGNTQGNTDNGPATIVGNYNVDANTGIYGELSGITGASVMMSNIAVPNVTGGKPASVSPDAVKLLTGKLGFHGLILTDDLKALDKQGIDLPSSITQSLQAGVDMPLFTFPGDAGIQQAIDAVKKANLGNRLDDAVTAVLNAKLRAGIVCGGGTAPQNGAAASQDSSTTPPSTSVADPLIRYKRYTQMKVMG